MSNHYAFLFERCKPPAKKDTCPNTIWCRVLLRMAVAEAINCIGSKPKSYTMQEYIDHLAEDFEIYFMENMGRVTYGPDGLVFTTLY